jgi:hypothetical protein
MDIGFLLDVLVGHGGGPSLTATGVLAWRRWIGAVPRAFAGRFQEAVQWLVTRSAP